MKKNADDVIQAMMRNKSVQVIVADWEDASYEIYEGCDPDRAWNEMHDAFHDEGIDLVTVDFMIDGEPSGEYLKLSLPATSLEDIEHVEGARLERIIRELRGQMELPLANVA